MNAQHQSWLLFATVLCVVSAVVITNERQATQQNKTLALLEKSNAELQRLQNEHGVLLRAQITADELGRLEASHMRARELRSRLLGLQKMAASTQSPLRSGVPEELSVKDWEFCGNTTPKAALKSVLWAASRGDVDRLAGLIGFNPEVRTQAEALYARLPLAAQAEYGSPENVVATLLSGNFPKDASSASLGDADESGDEASVEVRIGRAAGQGRTNLFRMSRAVGGWRLLVPSDVISGYEKILAGESSLPESGDP
jgi:hypothetical protein